MIKSSDDDPIIADFINNLNIIIDAGEGNLDQYVSDNIMNISDTQLEKEAATIGEIVVCLSYVVRKKGEEYIYNLISDEHENCRDFARWLTDYAKNSYRVYRLLECIRQLEVEQFQKAVTIVMKYKIIYNIGRDAISRVIEKEGVSEEVFVKLSMLMREYFEMTIRDGKSKEFIEKKFNMQYGIPDNFLAIMWDTYIKYETQLWQRLIMRGYTHIENIIDTFMENE